MIPLAQLLQPSEDGEHRIIIIKKGNGMGSGLGPDPNCIRRKALEAEREALDQREKEIDAELGQEDDDEELLDKKILNSEQKTKFTS